MTVLKRREFAKWQAAEMITDSVLCNAIREMEVGLIDADLGGCLYKKRIAREDGVKAAGIALYSRQESGIAMYFCSDLRKVPGLISPKAKRRRCATQAKFS